MTPPSNRDRDALVWDDERRPARPKPQPGGAQSISDAAEPEAPGPAASAPAATSPADDRIALRDAAERYDVAVPTLRRWCRSGQIDAVLVDGPSGRRWMATPASIAERVATGQRPTAGEDAPPAAPEAGAMLVPRAAWDKLMDQLGNLHESGQQLADARERAARFETEATFLRERLAELRTERDELRERAQEQPAAPPATQPPPVAQGLGHVVRNWRRRFRRTSE